MKLEKYDKDDGKKVWLTEEEIEAFLETADDTEKRIAFSLAARCGLRGAEVIDVTPPDIVDSPAGKRVRVRSGKGDKTRDTPLPDDLAATIKAYADVREAGPDTPLVDKSRRTFERWVKHAAEERLAETDEFGYQFLGPHDLRRSWGTLLVQADVEPGLIMTWGGWESWRTFREHYLGAYTPKAERDQLEKVGWL